MVVKGGLILSGRLKEEKVMYCKKCGQQLREGAAFCGNCGTPTSAQNQKTIADIGGNSEKSMNTFAQKTVEVEWSRKKKGEKKTFGILLLCILLLLVVGAGGCFLGYNLNEDKPKVAETMEELEQETEQTEERSEKEKEQGTGEKEDVEIQQEEATAEVMPEIEPVHHEGVENRIHTYELIVDDVTWTEAYSACIARGGHLVRIDSEEEYQVILQQIDEEEKGNIKFWLGGARDATDVYEYRWIYEDGTYGSAVLNEDEPFLFYWLNGEPSFYDESILQDEMYMNMFYVSKEERWVWNDVPDDLIAVAGFYSGTVGYICEYED